MQGAVVRDWQHADLIAPLQPEKQQAHRLSSDALQVHPPVTAGGGGCHQLSDLHLEGIQVGAVEASCWTNVT